MMAGLAGCELAEIPVEPHDPGDVTNVQVDLGSDYGDQIFYDIRTNSVISSNIKTAWDLGFESSEAGWKIILNSSRLAAIAHTGSTDFSAITSSDGWTWNYDANTGDLDSTAVGDWRSGGEVLILDRGLNPDASHTGYVKMIIQDVDSSSFTVRMGSLDGSWDSTFAVLKDQNVTFTTFSIDSRTTVDIAPDKDGWTIVFTQYTNVFIDPPLAYLVVGVHLNRNGIEVAEDFTNTFENIDASMIDDYVFSADIDVIGYDWKEFDFDESEYITYPEKNYIIKEKDGTYYKLHFLDYYDDEGNRGAPKFEFQQL